MTLIISFLQFQPFYGGKKHRVTADVLWVFLCAIPVMSFFILVFLWSQERPCFPFIGQILEWFRRVLIFAPLWISNAVFTYNISSRYGQNELGPTEYMPEYQAYGQVAQLRELHSWSQVRDQWSYQLLSMSSIVDICLFWLVLLERRNH